MSLISLTDVVKEYRLGSTKVRALEDIDLSIDEGEFVSIWGPSGSGKSSLLNLIGALDSPTKGSVYLAGELLSGLDDDSLAKLRNSYVGFVFQSFNLIPVLNACENVMLPMQIGGASAGKARKQALERLEQVELGEHVVKRPDQLSGGQRQRVAIARALVSSPSLVIADEPTANLDSTTGLHIIKLLRKLNRDDGVTFVFSTHDPQLMELVDRRIHLKDGKILASGV